MSPAVAADRAGVREEKSAAGSERWTKMAVDVIGNPLGSLLPSAELQSFRLREEIGTKKRQRQAKKRPKHSSISQVKEGTYLLSRRLTHRIGSQIIILLRSVLKGQVKPYAGFGQPDGRSCNVYMLDVTNPRCMHGILYDRDCQSCHIAFENSYSNEVNP